jgi:hypothetical protein
MTRHAGSLASRLIDMRPGDVLYLDDTFCPGKATIQERAVRNLLVKVTELSGREYATERWVAVRVAPPEAKQLLAVTRHI